jgi:hypothetical protein
MAFMPRRGQPRIGHRPKKPLPNDVPWGGRMFPSLIPPLMQKPIPDSAALDAVPNLETEPCGMPPKPPAAGPICG